MIRNKFGIVDNIPIICVNADGKYIKEYESIGRAASKLNTSRYRISDNLSGKTLLFDNQYFFIEKQVYKQEKNYSLKHRTFVKKIKQ